MQSESSLTQSFRLQRVVMGIHFNIKELSLAVFYYFNAEVWLIQCLLNSRVRPPPEGCCFSVYNSLYHSLIVFQIEEITFKNYYTAYITVRLLRRTSGQNGPTKWCTALRDLLLMDNPHTETGSQDYFSIHRKQVSHSVCL